MNLWSTLNELDRMQEEMNRVFGQAYKPYGDRRQRLAFLPGYSARRYPLINLFEEQDAFVVEALAPGLNTENINVSIVGNQLTLSGEKVRSNGDAKPEAFHRNERAAGKFIRTVELPAEVDSDKIKAEYKNGILTITAPKAEKARPRSIEIKVAN
ncbi:Hsp20/alpha crystallin family protein [bacterium]|nr:Hsp20/alpha crystallin family protein [bacterium]